MTSSNAEALNKKYILLTNLGNKHSQLMKFGQLVLFQKKKFHQKIPQKLQPEN